MFSVCLCAYTVPKKIKNHSEGIPNIKSFLKLYDLTDIEYPTAINKNNYALFGKSNPEIVLIEISQFASEKFAYVHKSTKQSCVSQQYFEREKKAALLLILNNISIEEKLSKIMTSITDFHNYKKNKKGHDILDEKEDYVAINMNRSIKNNQLTIILLSVKIMP